MSTKAYHAWKMDKKSVSKFHKLILRLTSFVEENAKKIILDECTKEFILSHLKNKEFNFKEASEISKNFYEEGLFCSRISIYNDNKTPIVYSSFFEKFPDWFTKYFSDFHYQNSTDKPDYISKKEWSQREKFWTNDVKNYTISFITKEDLFRITPIKFEFASKEQIDKHFKSVFEGAFIFSKFFKEKMEDSGLKKDDSDFWKKVESIRKKCEEDFPEYLKTIEYPNIEELYYKRGN